MTISVFVRMIGGERESERENESEWERERESERERRERERKMVETQRAIGTGESNFTQNCDIQIADCYRVTKHSFDKRPAEQRKG